MTLKEDDLILDQCLPPSSYITQSCLQISSNQTKLLSALKFMNHNLEH